MVTRHPPVALAVCIAVLTAACGGEKNAPTDGGADATSDGHMSDSGADAGTDDPFPNGPPDPYVCDDGTRITGEPMPLSPEEEGQWRFIPVDGMKCRDGSDTGIGVNWSSLSPNVVVFLNGGNACFDSITCNAAITPDHFDGSSLAVTVPYLDYGFLDRTNPANPMRDWSYVFVPYCTGDVHAGTKTEPGFLGNYFVGYANMQKVLEKVVPTFPNATQVVLGGASAGGFGAVLNYARTQRAFGCTPVELLDDSGPPLNDKVLRPCLQARVREMWGLNAVLPDDCDTCTLDNGGGLGHLAPYLAAKYPERRMALLSALQDGVIRQFFGYGTIGCRENATTHTLAFGSVTPENYEAGLDDLRDTALGPYDNFRVFYTPSTAHVLGGNVNFQYAMPAIHTWMGQMLSGSDSWTNEEVTAP